MIVVELAGTIGGQAPKRSEHNGRLYRVAIVNNGRRFGECLGSLVGEEKQNKITLSWCQLVGPTLVD